MYKDKVKEKEASRERSRRYRESHKGVTNGQGVTVTSQAQGVTESVTTKEGVTVLHKVDLKAHKQPAVYPPLVYALADPVKRAKLQAITASLKAHGQLDNVYYGVSGVTFKTVNECLECTA